MVKAVDHDGASSIATTVVETGKGAAKWLIGVPLVLALVGAVIGATIAATAATGGAAAPLISEGTAAILGGAAKWALGGLALGGAASVFAAPWVAGFGALFGLAKGHEKVGKERAAYERQAGVRGQFASAKMEQAHAIGAQQGYVQGVQEGHAIALQQMRDAMIRDQMAKAANQNATVCKTECKHADAEMKRREAAAAAGAQRA